MEPFVVLTDGGAYQGTITLTELLRMCRAARVMMASALAGDQAARQSIETVFALALNSGPQRARAVTSAFLLREALVEEQERKNSSSVTTMAHEPACSDHPPDVVCESCPPDRVAAAARRRARA